MAAALGVFCSPLFLPDFGVLIAPTPAFAGVPLVLASCLAGVTFAFGFLADPLAGRARLAGVAPDSGWEDWSPNILL